METIQNISQYELERGKPVPSKNHSIVQLVLGGILLRYSKQFNFFSELSLKLGDFQPTPDISIYPKSPVNWTHDEAKMTEPPILVIEIMSPFQGIQEIIDKIEQYFQHGVKSCWLVHPAIQSITFFTPDMRSKTFNSGSIKDHATGIEISVEEVFSFGNGG
jgi:Uma2 family endonuclease